MQNGPVVANMVVFKDLLAYSWGIYQLEADFDELVGAHAVLIEGFGTHIDQEYWVVRNSWGSEWGEHHGYFRILIGNSFIAEAGAYSCDPF